MKAAAKWTLRGCQWWWQWVTNGFVSHSFQICKCRVLGVVSAGSCCCWGALGGSLMESTKPQQLSPICQCIRPREPRQSWSATTIKTLTPNWALHQSPQTPKIYHSRVNFLLMMAKMKQNRTLTIGRGQILRQNSVRCFACFDIHCHHTIFWGNYSTYDDKDHIHGNDYNKNSCCKGFFQIIMM